MKQYPGIMCNPFPTNQWKFNNFDIFLQMPIKVTETRATIVLLTLSSFL